MNCIVNVCDNWGIGLEDRLLVSLSADLRRFRQLTTGQVVILGRKTLSTFPGGRPLKNRTNLILTRRPDRVPEGAVAASSLEALLALARGYDRDRLWVIGGASVYEALLPYCRRAFVTKTHLAPKADRFFPDLDRLPGWRLVQTSQPMEEGGVFFQYLDYENSAPLPL